MDCKNIIAAVPTERSAALLETFLTSYLTPAFGALPKSETELLVLRLLKDLGAIEERPSVYDLVSALKITRTKARKLIYEQDLRSRTETDLDEEVRRILHHPIIQKSGNSFILEVENPLVSDHLRAKVQKLGHISDGSFSPSIVRLPLDAMTALIESILSKKEQESVRKVLINAGAPDTSFNGLIKAVLLNVGKKLADESGKDAAEKASEFISPILDGTIGSIKDRLTKLFDKDHPGTAV